MSSMTDLGFLSPDGVTYAFDSRANGYSRGEGFGVIIPKRVADAIRDGNTIRAVIRNTDANEDGRTPGITQPSQKAQEELLREAYREFDPGTTRFFEAHGTGTAIGDPTEASALNAVFGENRTKDQTLYVDAVKSNTGHLEGASGLASVIKTVLVLEKGVIPLNAKYDRVNPDIPLTDWNIEVCAYQDHRISSLNIILSFHRSLSHGLLMAYEEHRLTDSALGVLTFTSWVLLGNILVSELNRSLLEPTRISRKSQYSQFSSPTERAPGSCQQHTKLQVSGWWLFSPATAIGLVGIRSRWN